MATSNGRRSTQKKTATVKKETGSSGRKTAANIKNAAPKGSFFQFLIETTFGRFLLGFAILLLLVGLNLLFSLNSFDRFFLLVGIELTVFVLLIWIIFLIRNRKKQE